MLPVKVGVMKASQIVFGLNVLTVAFSFLLPIFHLQVPFTSSLRWSQEAHFYFKIEDYFLKVKKRAASKCSLPQFLT